MMRQILAGELELTGRQIDVRIVEIRTGTPPLVRVALSSSQRLNEMDIDTLEQLISARIGRAIELEAEFNLRR
jgi:hypothetical protein